MGILTDKINNGSIINSLKSKKHTKIRETVAMPAPNKRFGASGGVTPQKVSCEN
jgi:hypothetical protein